MCQFQCFSSDPSLNVGISYLPKGIWIIKFRRHSFYLGSRQLSSTKFLNLKFLCQPFPNKHSNNIAKTQFLHSVVNARTAYVVNNIRLYPCNSFHISTSHFAHEINIRCTYILNEPVSGITGHNYIYIFF